MHGFAPFLLYPSEFDQLSSWRGKTQLFFKFHLCSRKRIFTLANLAFGNCPEPVIFVSPFFLSFCLPSLLLSNPISAFPFPRPSVVCRPQSCCSGSRVGCDQIESRTERITPQSRALL